MSETLAEKVWRLSGPSALKHEIADALLAAERATKFNEGPAGQDALRLALIQEIAHQLHGMAFSHDTFGMKLAREVATKAVDAAICAPAPACPYCKQPKPAMSTHPGPFCCSECEDAYEMQSAPSPAAAEPGYSLHGDPPAGEGYRLDIEAVDREMKRRAAQGEVRDDG